MTTILSRAELAKALGNDPKVLRAFEDLQRDVVDGTTQQAANVQATAALQDATVITLSPNDAFNNERVLGVGPGLALRDNGATLDLLLQYLIVLNGRYRVTFNLLGDTNVDMPTSGRLLTDEEYAGGPYANDAAAAADGVPVGGLYRVSGGSVAWRQV